MAYLYNEHENNESYDAKCKNSKLIVTGCTENMLKKMLDKQLNNIIQITFSCDLVN
jgi:hypothetical protein